MKIVYTDKIKMKPHKLLKNKIKSGKKFYLSFLSRLCRLFRLFRLFKLVIDKQIKAEWSNEAAS